MATLHVRNVPEDLYTNFKSLAEQKGHSLSAEVVDMMERWLEEQMMHRRNKAVFTRIRRRRIKLASGMPAPEDIIREFRDR